MRRLGRMLVLALVATTILVQPAEETEAQIFLQCTYWGCVFWVLRQSSRCAAAGSPLSRKDLLRVGRRCVDVQP